MNEIEFTELLFKYVSENLYKVIGFVITSFGTTITVTWFVSKSWYKREINHLKSTKKSECQILHDQVGYLTQKLQDNNSYATGIIEVAKHQLLQNKSELSLLDNKGIITKYEDKINALKEEYDASINKLKKEKENLYELLKNSRAQKSEMLDRLYIIVSFSSNLHSNSYFNKQIDLCYNDLYNRKDDDDFYIIYSKFSSLLSNHLIFYFNHLQKEKNKSDINFFNNRIDNLNHTIKIIKPFIYDENDNSSHFKTIIDKIKKSLEELNGDKKDDENDKKEM